MKQNKFPLHLYLYNKLTDGKNPKENFGKCGLRDYPIKVQLKFGGIFGLVKFLRNFVMKMANYGVHYQNYVTIIIFKDFSHCNN